MPRARRTGGVSTSPRCWKTVSMTVVLVWARSIPKKIASGVARPRAEATVATTPIVRPIWSTPPVSIPFFISRKLLSESSMPMVKRRKMIPSSARISTSARFVMKPRPYGPAIIPVRKNATIPGTFNRWQRASAPIASANMIRICSRKAASMVRLPYWLWLFWIIRSQVYPGRCYAIALQRGPAFDNPADGIQRTVALLFR